MKNIDIQGKQFIIGGEVRPYKMFTQFCLLAHYLPGGDRQRGRACLDRIKTYGGDGPRLFGENRDWFNRGDKSGFFGNPDWTYMVDTYGPEWDNGGHAKLKLLSGTTEAVQRLAADLAERDMVAEFCCVATVKGRDASVTSHSLNRWAQLFADLFPDPRNTMFLHEAVNEANAHADIPRSEAFMFGSRWRRSSSDPSHHNYPASTIGISLGGQLNPGDWFSDAYYTHRNIHPPRGPRWYETPFDYLLTSNPNRPTALNETVCVLSQQWWDKFVVPGIFGGNQCTTDHIRAVDYLKTAYDKGLSVCLHYGPGMSSNPDLPIDPVEERFREVFGGGIVAKPEYRNIIKAAYLEILGRQADESGLEHYNELMKLGVTKATVEDILMRSQEFKDKNF
jgi:hypothetical protein